MEKQKILEIVDYIRKNDNVQSIDTARAICNDIFEELIATLKLQVGINKQSANDFTENILIPQMQNKVQKANKEYQESLCKI